MKKNLKVLHIEESHTLQIWLYMISLSVLLFSCEKTKYPWQPEISAPNYYPVAGHINFGVAGNGSNTSLDNGWGDEYGGVVSGQRYKDIPTEVIY